MPSDGVSSIFKAAPAVKAVITLVLIENSQEMVSAWEDLRTHYLPTLLGTMRVANPVVPIPVLWLTTIPVGDDSASLHSAPPRQYNQLPELKFSSAPDNRVSSRVINRAIELMLGATGPFQGGPVSFHLIIVAASTPLEGTWGALTTTRAQIGQSEWQVLGQKMAQTGIHCHMVLRSSQDMRAMNDLFMSNLELQGHQQVAPWFTTSPDYTFYLSSSHTVSQSLAIPPAEKGFSIAPRPPVQRHQTYPQDTRRPSPEAPAQHQVGSAPSLVTSLQKVHGLSRKKLYGAQPTRQPFVREEPVRTKYRHAPTPLSIPAGGQSFATPEDGHAVGKTKADRGGRVDRPSHFGGVSDQIPPGRRSPWNRSRMSSPDMGSVPSSPTTSLSSHHEISPTMPIYPELAGYSTAPTTTLTTYSPDMIPPTPVAEGSFSATMSPMNDPSVGYFPISAPLQPPLSAVLPVPSQGPAWAPVAQPANSSPVMKSRGMHSSVRHHSQDLQHGASLQSLNAMSSKYRLDSVIPSVPSNESRVGTRIGAPKVKDAGDVPFLFSPELEAATAAKLKAALQSSATQLPAFTSMNNYTTDGACASDLFSAIFVD
ncbi:hypothetical protein HYDPIDRAFT_30432 [Hydnomerulius pinastri MD-312]|uniref:Uncharacterized protein n=1 Tax=Hydnomerulius pinastri MD-312 TaxID=994086 RepID=A0A0C9WCV1_9AGAM|nr:hypothetical protein HYDPIDRAFT_30432 [Hydnomerulius pinastri MD-312]